MCNLTENSVFWNMTELFSVQWTKDLDWRLLRQSAVDVSIVRVVLRQLVFGLVGAQTSLAWALDSGSNCERAEPKQSPACSSLALVRFEWNIGFVHHATWHVPQPGRECTVTCTLACACSVVLLMVTFYYYLDLNGAKLCKNMEFIQLKGFIFDSWYP